MGAPKGAPISPFPKMGNGANRTKGPISPLRGVATPLRGRIGVHKNPDKPPLPKEEGGAISLRHGNPRSRGGAQ